MATAQNLNIIITITVSKRKTETKCKQLNGTKYTTQQKAIIVSFTYK